MCASHTNPAVRVFLCEAQTAAGSTAKEFILQLSKVPAALFFGVSYVIMIPLKQLQTLLPDALLDELALTYEVDARNQVRLTGKLVFLCLLHTLLYHKNLTLRLLEEAYQQYTGHHADHSSFGKRLAVIKPDYFAALFRRLFDQLAPQAAEGEKRTLHLRFVDATTVTLSAKLLTFGLLVGTRNPGRARRHVKSVVELDEGRPNLLHVCKEKAENADSTALGQTMAGATQPGDLWVFDKGCHSRERLLALHTLGAFFLTPHSQQSVQTLRVVWEADGELVPATPPKKEEPRFVVLRVETAVFANSQVKQNAKWRVMPLVLVSGLRFDERSQSWKPLTLMTNLAVRDDLIGPYTFAELGEIYARRWDIEVFFKFVKQHLNYSHLTSRSENGIRVMLYMSLIAALLLLWYQRQTKIDRGWRSVKSWFAFDLQRWLSDAFGEAFAALATKHFLLATRQQE